MELPTETREILAGRTGQARETLSSRTPQSRTERLAMPPLRVPADPRRHQEPTENSAFDPDESIVRKDPESRGDPGDCSGAAFDDGVRLLLHAPDFAHIALQGQRTIHPGSHIAEPVWE